MVRMSTLRGVGAACLVVIYLLAGTLHGVCDLDVTNPGGKSAVVFLVGQTGSHSDQKGLTEHHCHGCFSVAAAEPPLSVSFLELAAAPSWLLPPRQVGITPDADSPPPKGLT